MKRFLRNSALITGLISASVCSYSMSLNQLFIVSKGSMAGSAALMDLNFVSSGPSNPSIVATNIGFYLDSACTMSANPIGSSVGGGSFPIANNQTLSLNPKSLHDFIQSKGIANPGTIQCVRIGFFAPPYVSRPTSGSVCPGFTENCTVGGTCITSSPLTTVNLATMVGGCTLPIGHA